MRFSKFFLLYLNGYISCV